MSTNFYSGYMPEKPTSKVLNPPGGRSNNIFGFDDTPSNGSTNGSSNGQQQQQKSSLTPAQEAVVNRQHQQCGSSNILGAAYDNVDQRQNRQQQQQQQYNHQQQQQQQQQQETQTATKNRGKRTGYNPITGENYEDEVPHQSPTKAPVEQQVPQPQEQQQGGNLHTSSRVLQPPGGRSTKLW